MTFEKIKIKLNYIYHILRSLYYFWLTVYKYCYTFCKGNLEKGPQSTVLYYSSQVHCPRNNLIIRFKNPAWLSWSRCNEMCLVCGPYTVQYSICYQNPNIHSRIRSSRDRQGFYIGGYSDYFWNSVLYRNQRQYSCKWHISNLPFSEKWLASRSICI